MIIFEIVITIFSYWCIGVVRIKVMLLTLGVEYREISHKWAEEALHKEITYIRLDVHNVTRKEKSIEDWQLGGITCNVQGWSKI